MICRLIDSALVVLKLLMFNVCGITGIYKNRFFQFPVLKGLSEMFYGWKPMSEAYSEPCQTSKLECFPKIVNG